MKAARHSIRFMEPRVIFKTFIVVVWLLLALSIFKREVRNLARLPARAALGYEESKLEADGPVYEFASKLAQLVPPDGSITYLYKRFSLFKKAVYYLYPREVTPVAFFDTLPEGLFESDYMAVYLPGTDGVLSSLDANQGLVKLYGKDGVALYRVVGRISDAPGQLHSGRGL